MVKRKKLKQNKIKLARLAEESITVESFLVNYLGIRDNNTLSNQISHKDIKALIPHLVRPSFDYIIEFPDLVYNGEVILVEDSYGSVVPYFNPLFLREKKDGEFEELTKEAILERPKDDMDFIGEFVEEKPQEEIPNINDIDITKLSNYELKKLLHVYESHGIISAYRKVRNELIYRKDSRHSSKESKERVLRKSLKNERFDY